MFIFFGVQSYHNATQMPARQTKATKPSTRMSLPSLVYSSLGLENGVLRALVILWIVTSLTAIVLAIARVIKAPPGLVVAYVFATLAATTLTLFTSNCLARGGCIRFAITIIAAGFATSTILLVLLATMHA